MCFPEWRTLPFHDGDAAGLCAGVGFAAYPQSQPQAGSHRAAQVPPLQCMATTYPMPNRASTHRTPTQVDAMCRIVPL